MLIEKTRGGRKKNLSADESTQIKKLIKDNKYTLTSIAETYGVSKTYLYKYFSVKELREEGKDERKK